MSEEDGPFVGLCDLEAGGAAVMVEKCAFQRRARVERERPRQVRAG